MISTLMATAALTWINPNCATGPCDVKAVRLYIEKVNDPKLRLAGNMMAAEIETSKKEDLKNYAFVQYIKGCLFEASNLGEYRLANRQLFGRSVPFKHTSWTIDSGEDTDPIYWSNPDAGYDEMRGFEIPRNSFYVNDNPNVTENFKTWAGKIKNLVSNKIYISDVPTMSYFEDKNGIITARTASLEFRVCLHKISDVPVSVASPETIIGEPITCMDWSSNYQFNFGKKKFEEKAAIHSSCK